MSETKQKKMRSNNHQMSAWDDKFLVIDNLPDFNNLNSKIELCIIKTNFSKSDLKHIEKLKSSNPCTEFWIYSDKLTRENIILANKFDIKNIISSPLDKTMVEDFFNNKYKNKTQYKYQEDKYDYSIIANSKIMIVDDNALNIELLKEILQPFNIEIATYSKPKEAHQIALNEKFDLFLLDVMMPEMSGFELAKRIKSSPINKDGAIIFISALSDTHNKITGYDLGSFAYIEKPFDINIVKSQIFNFLKNKKKEEIINSSRETFLATVAHDLKTPINAEINALKLLLGKNLGNLEGVQEEIIEDILNSTNFMKDMVENILCKNKMENNKLTLSKEVYSLEKVIEHCIDITKYILKPKHQKIELKCVNDILLPLDFIEIKRAIHNLIANASEYSPTGGKIFIEIFKTNDKVGIVVQDFGKGIEIENQDDVFVQYITYAKKYKKIGTGLGLYITKKIIEAHNGEITLESKVGYGTKITVYLPAYVRE